MPRVAATRPKWVSWLGDDLLKESDQGLCTFFDREQISRALSAGLAERLRQFSIREQASERLRQRGGLTLWNEQTGHAIAHHFGDTSNRSRNHWQSGGHCFHHDRRQVVHPAARFGNAGQREDCALRETANDLALRLRSGEDDACR